MPPRRLVNSQTNSIQLVQRADDPSDHQELERGLKRIYDPERCNEPRDHISLPQVCL